MRTSSAQLALLIAFAVLVGDYAFRCWQSPIVPEYQISSTVTPMSAPERPNPNKHVYLRRTWTFTEAPEYAWLEVKGHDLLQVFVNGRQVGRSARMGTGRIGGSLVDITSKLHAGENTIALHSLQLVNGRRPQLAVDGMCYFPGGTTASLGGVEGWVASDLYDRRGTFWYETDFPDEHWQAPTVGEPANWIAQVDVPPDAIYTPRSAEWITPTAGHDGSATFAKQFELSAAPRQSWLRVIATGPFRLAVNGWLVQDDRAQLAIDTQRKPVEYTFDVAPLLRQGSNIITVAVAEAGGLPRMQGEFETVVAGEKLSLMTDATWLSTAGIAGDWMQPDLQANHWLPAQVSPGYSGITPRSITRSFQTDFLNPTYRVLRGVQLVSVMAIAGLLAVAGATMVRGALHLVGGKNTELPAQLPYWALLPSTILAGGAGLMSWDMAWTSRQVYQPIFLMGIALLVVVLWLGLIAIASWRSSAAQTDVATTEPKQRSLRLAFAVCMIAIFVLAGWLRMRNILAEPIHHDEVSAYRFTMSVFEHGFPGVQAHEDMPFTYCSTSEIIYYFNSLFAFFTDEPRLIVRLPAVFWSMATLVLISFVANRWFNPYVALVACLLFAVSPHVIAMANFGRYLSATQFFTLLTTFLGYEAVRGVGRLRPALVWAAAVSFVLMYLSWEGSGLFGVGLALAALIHRRRHLAGVLATPAVYPASLLVILVVLAQNAHRILQQTQRLWFGTGISSMKLEPMWRFPFFDPDYFLLNASWTKDALLPMLAVGAACILVFKHHWKLPIRFLLICLLSNTGLMAVLLPLHANRYAFHLTPLVILLAGVAVVSMLTPLFQAVRSSRYPALRWYAAAVAVPTVALLLAIGSGWFVRTSELKSFSTAAQGVGQLRSPDWRQPTEFIVSNYQPGDVIISILPHAQEFVLQQLASDRLPDGKVEGVSIDYWLETRLVLQATIGDHHEVPRDRRSGAVMLHSLDQLEQLFAENDRVWYCTNRRGNTKINDSIVSRYLREHMDVVYEDLATSVLLRDRNHRTASVRLEEQKASRLASEFYLE